MMASEAVLMEPPRPHRVRTFTSHVALADVTTAALVAATAAIPISIIDYSIMARVAGVTDSSLRELWRGTKTLFLRPHRFFLPCAENKCSLVYRVCFTVYGATYIASNISKSYGESRGWRPESANLAAGVASGVMNTLASVWKDSIILKSLPPVGGAGGVDMSKKCVPWMTRGLFCARDTLTCVAAFTLAPMLATWLTQYCYCPRKKAISGSSNNNNSNNNNNNINNADAGKIRTPLSCEDLAQITTPAVLQFVTTLFHIGAIRYRQTYPKFNITDFNQSLRETYMSSVMLRIVRIVPAFGTGGIMNREVRWNLLDRAEPPHQHSR